MPAEQYVVIYFNVALQAWERIKALANLYDVEAESLPENAFDVREDASSPSRDLIYWWGRDGWRDGFYHGVLSLDPSPSDGWNVGYTASTDLRAMSALSARRLMQAVFDPCLTGDAPALPEDDS